jgi:alanyl-tRNA synthetase
VTLLVGVTDDQSKRLNAGALIGQIAPHIGGRGGGKPTLAQAGGTDPAGLDKALQQLEQLVRDQLA